jgi:hypothetical protein
MARATVLRQLKIREVSGVDRGAGEGVRVMLMKRELSESHPGGEGGKRTRGGKNRGRAMTLFAHQQAARAAFAPPTAPKSAPKPKNPGQRRVNIHRRAEEKTMKLSAAVKAYLKRNAITEAMAVAKRNFSAKERRAATAVGHAMPGGGYPINDVSDLHNAIQAIGRAKNPGKTKAHIRRQAARLGATSALPESWGKRYQNKLIKTARYLGLISQLTKNAMSFEDVLDDMASTDTAEGVVEAVRDACHALKDSIESISECDDLAPNDKAAAISESFGQFMDHLGTIAPKNVTKAFKRGVGPMAGLAKKLKKTYTSVPAHDATPPTKANDTKQSTGSEELDEGKTRVSTATTPPENKKKMKKRLRKAMKKQLKKVAGEATLWQKRTKALLTLDKAAKDYMDNADSDMDDEKKTKFLDMSPKERTKFMEANPLATIAEKRMAELPEPVRKALEEGKVNAERVTKLAEERDVAEFSKRAIDLGQASTFGAPLRTLVKGIGTEEERIKALDEVLAVIKGQAEQIRTGNLFKEFGSNQLQGGTAAQELTAKRDALLSEVTKSGQKMTPEQAFAKVYEDPANRDLVQRYKAEKDKSHAIAA